jgi:undecaprenyl phosphate-alpha-L-ara4FN deformylase
VTLPTYDELIGRDGIHNNNYNEHLLALLRPDQLNVLTIHAEVEGIACASLFEDFLDRAAMRRIRFTTLHTLLDEAPKPILTGQAFQAPLPGREGAVCQQAGEGQTS